MTPLLNRFVTVRMTNGALLDARIFPYTTHQDLDLSWWGYFLEAEGQLYGVFGGKDQVPDATRISEAALVNTMKRVLRHHYDPRRQSWQIDGPVPALDAAPKTPRDHSYHGTFVRDRPHMQKKDACLHCHQVKDMLNASAVADGSFTQAAFTQPWPLPENVGITLDRDDGLLVRSVRSGSAAARAGIRTGDRLVLAGNRKLFGQADFRGVLHRAPLGDARIPVGWTHEGAYRSAMLSMRDGWRETQVWWRKSVYDGVIGEWMGFFPNRGPNQGKGKLSIRPYMGYGGDPWRKVGLRPNMEIVAINGRDDDWNSRQLLTWFKLNHKKGDRVTLRVRGGKEFSLRLPFK